ncbi:NAD-dependent epimerase/dehydratase family protein [Bradyrhizobium sp. DASA03005]|uniref:NAD-dependent epimerase/dehydratase family protein n=1 Tax=Bradyrhizobium TaxID=374 RepID=UPI00155F539A|nr:MULTISPECIES: NAD(P)-dependent oxidoreductase [Bradyrhizobium]MDD1518435.1 NAD(P)-dependent oxidoreductase [Bradyrhizobium sp. WBAH30]MDD1542233.1 NAD(P)-dependent oxidoreductase [Bradyrhizobium sp. WBAH41]MDD1556385.1 NAD(P)-dependent oxidoreductase [Bradyrhizobium sp. WBAH23]MDD1561774.1 NAD(P)-dependent oxidoreductase [Bradyrhizobium sp. WBAH33]MDD1589204.1 NAD(P)-dependent oxidoreductase [Bradyrhizobium sp. WBAH42]
MRIFVTGASGFLGSYLVADLLERGHEVAVLLRPDRAPWRLQEAIGRLNVIPGALEHLDGLRRPLEAFAPEAVVHMAWRGVAGSDRNGPDQAVNVADTVRLAELAASLGAKIFVGAGSQAEYGPYDRAIREDDIARPTTLYGMAKLGAGSMVLRLCEERELRAAWLRIFSTYGPKDADYWLIPSMIRNLRSGQHMALTVCEQRWGFLHARDAAAAFRIAATHDAARGIFNVGSPDAPPLRETVTKLRDLVDPRASLGFGELAYRPDQVMVLAADVSRMLALGWKPEVPLDEGLRETVDWHDATKSS